MADSKLDIILTAKDLSGQAFASMHRSITGLVGAAGLGALTATIADGVRSFENFNQKLMRAQSIIASTGAAAGLSAVDIGKMAKELDLSTLADRDAIMDAAGALLTFKSIAGDTFRRSIELGQDMAEVFGGDVRSKVVQLGKALEDPVKGVGALQEVGVSFTQTQKELIKTLVESGEKMKAQVVILDELQSQVGGAAAGAASGLNGKIDTLNYRWREFKENMASSVAASSLASGGIDMLARSLEHLSGFLRPDVTGMIENEIAGLQNRLKMFERIGGSGNVAGIEKITSRIDMLRRSLAELRNPAPDVGVDYGNLNARPVELPSLSGKTNDLNDLGDFQSQVAEGYRRQEEKVRAILRLESDLGTEYVDMWRIKAGEVKEIQERSWAAIGDSYTENFDLMKDAFTGWGADFSSMLTDAVWDADLSFGKIAESFGRMMTQMVIQKKVVEPLFDSIFTTNADGNIYGAHGLVPFASGGVVNRPTMFPFANGVGLMGEAGPEAIIPLTRMASGKLGVESSGGSNVNVTIINKAGVSVTPHKEVTPTGVDLRFVLDSEGGHNLSRHGSSMNRALRNVYGAREQLISR